MASNRRSKMMIRHYLPRLNIRLTLGDVKKEVIHMRTVSSQNVIWHVQMTEIGMRKKELF